MQVKLSVLDRNLSNQDVVRLPWVRDDKEAGLTVGLAQGKNMPRQKTPNSGPPTIPKMLKAA